MFTRIVNRLLRAVGRSSCPRVYRPTRKTPVLTTVDRHEKYEALVDEILEFHRGMELRTVVVLLDTTEAISVVSQILSFRGKKVDSLLRLHDLLRLSQDSNTEMFVGSSCRFQTGWSTHEEGIGLFVHHENGKGSNPNKYRNRVLSEEACIMVDGEFIVRNGFNITAEVSR